MPPIIEQNYEEQAFMRLLTVHFPEGLIKEIDNLIDQQYFPNRSEAIRSGVYFMLLTMGKTLTDPKATNAKLFSLFLEFMKGQMAGELLQTMSPTHTKTSLRKKGLKMDKEKIESIDKPLGQQAHLDRKARKRKVLELCAEGKEISSIAALMNIPYPTVYNMVRTAGIYIPKNRRVLDQDNTRNPIHPPSIDKVKCARKDCMGCFYYELNNETKKWDCIYGVN